MKKTDNFASAPPAEAQQPQGTFLPYSPTPSAPPAPAGTPIPVPFQPPQPPLAPYTYPINPQYGVHPSNSQHGVHQSVAMGTPQYGVPPPAVQMGGHQSAAQVVQMRLPFIPGRPPPVAPPGYVYVYHEHTSPLAIVLCILFFPIGIIFLLWAKEEYWLLQAAPQQGFVR